MTGWAGGGIALGVAVAATAGLLGVFWRPAPESIEPDSIEPDSTEPKPTGTAEAPAVPGQPAEQEAR